MKTALITGASSGLGFALADLFLRNGYRVIALSRRGLAPEGAETHQVDLADIKALRRLIKKIEPDLGELSVLINNAGVSPAARILNTPEFDYDNTIKINFLAPKALTELLLPKMCRPGIIVNIISRVGFEGRIGLCAYAVSKGLLAGYTEVLAQSSKKQDISVYGINPGFMLTGMITEIAIKAQKGESLLHVALPPEHSAKMIFSIIEGKAGLGPFFDLDSRVYHSWKTLL